MRVIVVGADGLIGSALSDSLRRNSHAVLGTTRRADKANGRERVFLDLAAPAPPPLPAGEVAVFCAAMAKFADCRNAPELARQVNVTAPSKLAREFAERGGRVVMLSSSVVFDGLRPYAKAELPPAPRSVYGQTKAAAEAEVLALGGSVLRMTKVLSAETGIVADWVVALDRGDSVRAFEDHRFCPIMLTQAIVAITALIAQPQAGVFQVSGAADISYADAARHLAGRLGVSPLRVEGTRAADNGIPDDEVTPFTSLDTTRLSALTGYTPLAPRAVLDRVFAASFAAVRAH